MPLAVRRLTSTLALSAAAALLASTGAEAAVMKPCRAGERVLCGRVSVPLDRFGDFPGRVSLAVRLHRATGPRRGTLLLLSGGPGQAVTLDFDAFNVRLRDNRFGDNVVRHYDVLGFDPRGAGGSGLLRCPALERVHRFYASEEIGRCAQRLGPRRDHYQTRDAVADIESVRAALRIPRLTIYGISYGTYVAQYYAKSHPTRVDRVILDSSLKLGPGDLQDATPVLALRRILTALCSGQCRRFSPNPVADLHAVLTQVGSGRLSGTLVGATGRPRVSTIGPKELSAIPLVVDFLPTVGAELPGSLRSALAGDSAALLRLARTAILDADRPGADPREFSDPLFYATVCTEATQLWPRTTPIHAREAEARATIASLDPAVLYPLTPAVLLDSLDHCLRWPTSASVRPLADEAGPPPRMPVLLLSGLRDMRTPVEDARVIARRLPRATLVTFPRTGHDVLGSLECAERTVERFLAGRPVRGCSANQSPRIRVLDPVPPAPTSLAEVPVGGREAGRAGRTACAVALGLLDAGRLAFDRRFDLGRRRAPGLRAGFATVTRDRGVVLMRFRLSGFSYVPGVSVSGSAVSRELRVFGAAAAPGVLRAGRDGSLRGRLGGRPVRTSLSRCLGPRAARFMLVPDRPATASPVANLRTPLPPAPHSVGRPG